MSGFTTGEYTRLSPPSMPRGRSTRVVLGLALFILAVLVWRSASSKRWTDSCERVGGCVQSNKRGNVVVDRSGIPQRRPDSRRAKNEEIEEDDDDVNLMKHAAEVNPFPTPEQHLDQLDRAALGLDDAEEDDVEDGGEDRIKSKLISVSRTQAGDDDDEEDAEKLEEGKPKVRFLPITEGTIGHEMMRYKQKLGKLQETQLKIDKEASLESRGIDVNTGIHMITTFFKGSYQDRRFKEILATLVSNLENPEITAVHLLWQAADPRYYIPDQIAKKLVERNLHMKLVLTEVQKQPTYKTMFLYANTVLQRGAIAVITNADIYFDHTLRCVTMPPKNYTSYYEEPEKIKNRVAIALSRRHSPLCNNKPDHRSYFDLCETYTLSHDAFIFAPPVPKSIVARTDHTQNQGYGAENIVIFEFKRENYQVINPCFTVRGYHLHCVSERHYVANFVNRSPPRPGSSVPIKRKCGMWIY